jgi:hypothetical protein
MLSMTPSRAVRGDTPVLFRANSAAKRRWSERVSSSMDAAAARAMVLCKAKGCILFMGDPASRPALSSGYTVFWKAPYDITRSLPDVVFDNDGVFGQNVVRRPSKDLAFETVLAYMREVFSLSNQTPRLQEILLTIMPFFRLPVTALKDESIPERCYRNGNRDILSVHKKSLSSFKVLIPELTRKYRHLMSEQRKTRSLDF